jgi:hypothetical protein
MVTKRSQKGGKIHHFAIEGVSFFIWLFVTAKSRHNAAGFRKLQKSGFSWLF